MELLFWCCVYYSHSYVDGLVQDCSISNALAKEILQACTTASSGYKINWTMVTAF